MFSDTGDPLIDKWEAELSAGLTPDLTEGMSPAEKEKNNIEKKLGKEKQKILSTLGTSASSKKSDEWIDILGT